MRWRLHHKYGLAENCRGAFQQGFTLVEILVSMAIMAILFGTMMPLMDKVWLSSEKSDTRQKMADLKRAMVGDQRMVQNGIRMHYGFVGDYGVLPSVISDLVIEPTWVVSGIWQGPYLVGAFDMKDYYNDAWHRQLVYTTYPPDAPLEVTYHVEGHPDVILKFAATLKSLGPDGLAGTADDLDENTDPELQILTSEVWPTNKVQGNLDYVVTAAAPNPGPDVFARLYVNYKGPIGDEVVFSGCSRLVVGELVAGEPKRVRQTLEIMDLLLPVGRDVVGSHIYTDADCTEPHIDTQANEAAAYVSDGLSTLSVNLPTVNYSYAP